jgi:hypothetical protein
MQQFVRADQVQDLDRRFNVIQNLVDEDRCR